MSIVQDIPPSVLSVFQEFALTHRNTLMEIRNLIFEVAETSPQIGQIEETLRWGVPAYLTQRPKTGSTIRLGIEKSTGLPAIFFNCRTTLVQEFRDQFGSALRYSKNRAILLETKEAHLIPGLRTCIKSALTYHLQN